MNKTSDKLKKVRKNFEHIYQKIRGKDYDILQALHQMMERKKSTKKIKIAIISIGRNQQDVEDLKWKQPSAKQQFLKLCQELQQHFEQDKDQSMRSTQKNISEMNEQILKMRKSLSEKGILMQLEKKKSSRSRGEIQNEEDQKMEQQNEEKQNFEDGQMHSIENMRKSSNKQQQEQSQDYKQQQEQLQLQEQYQQQQQYQQPQQMYENENQAQNGEKVSLDNRQTQKYEDLQHQHREQHKQQQKQQVKAIERIIQSKKVEHYQKGHHQIGDKMQKSSIKQRQQIGKINREQQKHGIQTNENKGHKLGNDVENKNTNEVHSKDRNKSGKEKKDENSRNKQVKPQIASNNEDKQAKHTQKQQVSKKMNQTDKINKIADTMEHEKSNAKNIANSNSNSKDIKNVKQTKQQNKSEQIIKQNHPIAQNTKQNQGRKLTEWTQIAMPQQKNKQGNQKQTAKQGKLDTLPEQLDNQFYQEQAQQLQPTNKSSKPHKYNPHIEIMKKLSKNKREMPQPRNELQGLYYKLKNKLLDLFAHYVKQLKTNSFTFDAYPQSLDLKTFSAYFKTFKLSQICKINQVPKYFKKYSANGAWLSESGFLIIHAKMLELDDDVIQYINNLLTQRQKSQTKYQQDLAAIKKLNIPQKDKLPKQRDLAKRKQQQDKTYNQFEAKMKKINELLSQEQIKKLIRKAEPKQSSVDVTSNKLNLNYDKQRLKKIVEAHSGIYKDDIIEKLKERKMEKQKKHQLQMNKILEKYKANNQGNPQANSNSSFNKSNQSTPHLHKLDGYGKRNRVKKFGVPGLSNLEEISKQAPKQRLKSEPKVKPYFVSKQLAEENVENSKNEASGLEKKPEIYRELSLPRLPKRKMRQQSIYESLKMIDTRAEMESIKKMLGFDRVKEKSYDGKDEQQQKMLNQFYSKERQLVEKQRKGKSPPVQNRMKFS